VINDLLIYVLVFLDSERSRRSLIPLQKCGLRHWRSLVGPLGQELAGEGLAK